MTNFPKELFVEQHIYDEDGEEEITLSLHDNVKEIEDSLTLVNQEKYFAVYKLEKIIKLCSRIDQEVVKRKE